MRSINAVVHSNTWQDFDPANGDLTSHVHNKQQLYVATFVMFLRKNLTAIIELLPQIAPFCPEVNLS